MRGFFFFFFQENGWPFCQAAKKSGRNNEVAVRRGFTVLASARVKDAFISENLN